VAESVQFENCTRDKKRGTELQSRQKTQDQHPKISRQSAQYSKKLPYYIPVIPFLNELQLIKLPDKKRRINNKKRGTRQQDAERFLQDAALLPFASLTRTQDSSQLLDRIVQQVAEIPELTERQEMSSYVQLMAGLKYDKEEIRRVFREGMMRESVIYQEILHEGEEKGRQLERRSLVILLIEQRVGAPSDGQRDRISSLNLDQLTALAIALLNFSTPDDLDAWLTQQQ